MITWIQLVGVFCHLVAFVCCVVGLVLPRWLTKTDGGSEVTIGLWEVCVAGVCQSVSSEGAILLERLGKDWFLSVQAFMVMASVTILLSFGLQLGALGICLCKRQLAHAQRWGSLWHRLLWWCLRILNLAVVFLMIAVLVFGIEAKTRNYANPEGPLNFGESYYVTVMTLVSTTVSCLLYELSYRKEQPDQVGDYILISDR